MVLLLKYMEVFIFISCTFPFSLQIFYELQCTNKFRLSLPISQTSNSPVFVTQLQLFPKVQLTIKSNARPFQKHVPPRCIWNKFIAAPAPYFQTDLMPDFRISSENKKKTNPITSLQTLFSFYISK